MTHRSFQDTSAVFTQAILVTLAFRPVTTVFAPTVFTGLHGNLETSTFF